jgi:hypothetical protein
VTAIVLRFIRTRADRRPLCQHRRQQRGPALGKRTICAADPPRNSTGGATTKPRNSRCLRIARRSNGRGVRQRFGDACRHFSPSHFTSPHPLRVSPRHRPHSRGKGTAGLTGAQHPEIFPPPPGRFSEGPSHPPHPLPWEQKARPRSGGPRETHTRPGPQDTSRPHWRV